MFYSILEILRIIVLLFIFGGLLSTLLGYVYSSLGFNLKNMEYAWLAWVAIFNLFFVLYRNKLQFSGWYIGKGREKLSKRTTFILAGSAVLLIIIPPFLSSR